MRVQKYISFLFSIFFVFSIFLFKTSFVNAQTLPVITIINPLREPNMVPGSFPLASLKNQWQLTHAYGIHATWLWQYTTLEDKKLVNFAKSQMKDQEFGLFLEIDKNFAQKAGVQYRGQGPWYFSDGLLLVSYDASERKKLIDTAFATFKNTFGYYPKTVGAWWLSADSLTYMQKKYGIVASLRAADQFDLDAYSIWGTPWSIPYVASTNNAGIPALTLDTSSKVVMMQWAPRDPVRAYGSTFDASTYSMQDYGLKGYDLLYFNYLTNIYLQKPLDQVVMGLEGGFPSYDGQYQQQLAQAAAWEKNGKISILPANEYAKRFLDSQQTLAPTHYFLTKDFQSDNQSFWYNSLQYRVGIEKEGNLVYLVDVRNYATDPTEDFLTLPNSQGLLRVSEPATIDSARIPSQKNFWGKALMHYV